MLSFCGLHGRGCAKQKHPPFFFFFCIYLIILSAVCVPASALTTEPSGQRVADPSPLTPPSAGQNLTLEQMDNGLYALSPPDHTLLLPPLAAAFPFTSRCPSSLFLHLPCPVLDCLNSQTHSCHHLFLCVSLSLLFLLLHSSPALLLLCISLHRLFYI